MDSNDETQSGLEEFLFKVEEVGDLVHDLVAANDATSLSNALDKSDEYLSRQSDTSDDCTGFDRTLINTEIPSSSVESDPQYTPEAVAFCQALEADAKERSQRLQMRQIIGNKKRKEGNEAFRKDNYDDALCLYTEALQQVPGDILLYTNRALTYLKLKLFQKAIEDCDAAIKLKENTLKAYLYKGKALIMLGQHDAAKDCFDMASLMNPEKESTVKSYIKNIEEWSS